MAVITFARLKPRTLRRKRESDVLWLRVSIYHLVALASQVSLNMQAPDNISRGSWIGSRHSIYSNLHYYDVNIQQHRFARKKTAPSYLKIIWRYQQIEYTPCCLRLAVVLQEYLRCAHGSFTMANWKGPFTKWLQRCTKILVQQLPSFWLCTPW